MPRYPRWPALALLGLALAPLAHPVTVNLAKSGEGLHVLAFACLMLQQFTCWC